VQTEPILTLTSATRRDSKHHEGLGFVRSGVATRVPMRVGKSKKPAEILSRFYLPLRVHCSDTILKKSYDTRSRYIISLMVFSLQRAYS
jgi:hypothetical protein